MISKADVIIASIGLFQSTRSAVISLSVGFGCCVLTAGSAVANPFLNNVRPTEMFVLAKSADDPALRARLLALSPAVSPDEAQRVEECAYNTGRDMAREWRVVPIPGVQNFLVNTGARKGGLCFQWATALLIRLNALKLQTLDLHWAEANPRGDGEHNVIVVTGKGQPFQKGIILDNWRYAGHLVYCWVTMDSQYRWKENPGELARRLQAIATPTPQPVSTLAKQNTGDPPTSSNKHNATLHQDLESRTPQPKQHQAESAHKSETKSLSSQPTVLINQP